MSTLVSKQFLTTNERISEILFGLIMVLGFTGSLSVTTADRAEVRTMLIGALGCNLAWGIIDGLFYLMSCLAEKGERLKIWRAYRSASSTGEADRIVRGLLPPMMAELLDPSGYEGIRRNLAGLADPPKHPGLHKDEWLAALMICLWVFATTFPVAIPFLVMQNVHHALRVSNGVAIVLLFISGYGFGRCVGYRPWLTGLAMVILGGILVGLTIRLGG
jgi:hypothetical protein